jgi:hypothetical protein
MQNSKVSGQTMSRQAVATTGSILMSIVLFSALSLVPTTNVNAQVECLGRCEQQLSLCLASGSGEQPAGCMSAYEACVDACLGAFTALLGE